jgi:peptidoglycan lytic transglycosylase
MRPWIVLLLLTLVPPLASGCAAARPGRSEPGQFAQEGYASYYAIRGGRTASGAPFDGRRLTAAHRTLPFGTRVRVTNLASGRSVVVTITDRGPFRHDRVIDVTRRAARILGFLQAGIARVRLEVVLD